MKALAQSTTPQGPSEQSIKQAAKRYNVPASEIRHATRYAQELGYTGSRPLVVSDGRILNRNEADWFEFCRKLREGS